MRRSNAFSVLRKTDLTRSTAIVGRLYLQKGEKMVGSVKLGREIATFEKDPEQFQKALFIFNTFVTTVC